MSTRSSLALLGLISGLLLLTILPWNGGALDVGSAPLAEETAPALAFTYSDGERVPLAMPATQPSVTCSVDITTTDNAPRTNNSFNTAAPIANYTGQSLLVRDVDYSDFGTGTVDVPTQSDFYRLDNSSVNHSYTIQAKPDRTINYNLGIIVYDREQQPIYTNTDTSTYSTIATFEALNAGPYFVEIFQASAQCEGHTYALIFNFTAPTPTPTPTGTPMPAPTNTPEPPPTVIGGWDRYEPNNTFEQATTIAPGITYSLNFVPYAGAEVDNDFFKIRVKPGLVLTCETSDLDPGVDPNMIFYSAPNFESVIGGNDDIAPGNFNSRFSYYSTYEGFVYVLVGQGDRMSAEDAARGSDYKLTCTLTVPGRNDGTATPVPDKDYTPPTRTPVPPPATATPSTSPIATPTEPVGGDVDLSFRRVSTPEPPAPTPTPTGFRTFRVLIYYDGNNDGQPGAGEGVPGFYVRVLSPTNGEELARGYTDDQGQVSFTVASVGTVRVLIPLLGFDRLIEATQPEVTVRIAPPSLPDAIP